MIANVALSAVLALPVPVKLDGGHLPTAAFQRHVAHVVLTIAAPRETVLTLNWSLRSPSGAARVARKIIAVSPGHRSKADFSYELFEDGDHTVTVVAQAAGAEVARWERHLEVRGAREAPMLFPNYYRQRLTVVGGSDVETSFGRLRPVGRRMGRVSARGPGIVRYSAGSGRTVSETG